MGKLLKNKNGAQYYEITDKELITCTSNSQPVCDHCLTSLLNKKDILLIPILNMAFCRSCGEGALENIVSYPEEKYIEDRRIEYYNHQFKIGEK